MESFLSLQFLDALCANVTIHRVIVCGLHRPPMPPQRFSAPEARPVPAAFPVTVFKDVHGVPVENRAVLNREEVPCVFRHVITSKAGDIPPRRGVKGQRT